MDNLTNFMEFLIMDVSTSRGHQILQGLMFLLIFLGSLTENLLTVIVIVTDPHLHTPMYFFICNLSLIDLCSMIVALPKMIMNSLTGNKSISLLTCASQIFLFICFVVTGFSFFVVMPCDCYVAICCPLHYGLTITPHLCTQAAGCSWTCGLVYSAIHMGIMFRLPFTKSNVIHQYFCDIPQILRISSSDVHFSETLVLAVNSVIFLVCFAFLIKSYIDIISMVLKMHSVEACNKALSSCTPQLAIPILFIISGFIAVFDPNANEASLCNLLTAIIYAMVPPFINTIIYSLWNRKINTALGRMFHRYFEFPSRVFFNKKMLKTI